MTTQAPAVEMVNHPNHYNSHPSGVEAITVIQHMPFNFGNAYKYVYRRNDKANPLQDLRKADKYLEFELAYIDKFKRSGLQRFWDHVFAIFAARVPADVLVMLNRVYVTETESDLAEYFYGEATNAMHSYNDGDWAQYRACVVKMKDTVGLMIHNQVLAMAT